MTKPTFTDYPTLRKWLKENQSRLALEAYQRYLDNPPGVACWVAPRNSSAMRDMAQIQKVDDLGKQSYTWIPIQEAKLMVPQLDIIGYDPQTEIIVITPDLDNGRIGTVIFTDCWPNPISAYAEKDHQLPDLSTDAAIMLYVQMNVSYLSYLAYDHYLLNGQKAGLLVLNINDAASSIMNDPDLSIPQHVMQRMNAKACVTWISKEGFDAMPNPDTTRRAVKEWLDHINFKESYILMVDEGHYSRIALMNPPPELQPNEVHKKVQSITGQSTD